MQPLEQVEVDGGRGGKKEDGGEASQASHQGTPIHTMKDIFEFFKKCNRGE